MYQNCGAVLVEPRGVEPLSEDQKTRASPSAVCVLTFPPPDSHRRDSGFSSFIWSGPLQSLGGLVPCYYDVDGLRGRTLRVDGRRLSGDRNDRIIVSYCFFPVVGRFRAAARFSVPPHPRRNQIRPRAIGGGAFAATIIIPRFRPFVNLRGRVFPGQAGGGERAGGYCTRSRYSAFT